jgi:aminoglycoside/choline kinase family phosphotransferase
MKQPAVALKYEESAPVTSSPRRRNVLPPPSPEALTKALGIGTLTIDWLAGDGSDRCYYRIRSHELSQSLVLMQLSGSDAEALKKGGYDWIKIAAILSRFGINVPQVVCEMPDHAALIIEDSGDRMLEGQVFGLTTLGRTTEAEKIYAGCFEILSKFLLIKPDPSSVWCQRQFDEERFVWELNFFLKKYVEAVAKMELSESDRAAFQRDAASLSRSLAATSKWFVHRDFHSRNVMAPGSGELVVIDFQDARLGPPSYDLVSLCFDSYVPFPKESRRSLLDDGITHIEKACGADVAELISQQWQAMLLQRQLKAIGSFGFLTIDKNKGDYLKYVVPALKTMEDQNVYDKRWPWISGELLGRMRRFVDTQY